jgi:hypothetical protein
MNAAVFGWAADAICASRRKGAKNAHPDRIIGVSGLEHDPYPRSNFRDGPRADGEAGKGPHHTGPEHVRHSNLHATSAERIGRVDDHGPVDTMERSQRPLLPTQVRLNRQQVTRRYRHDRVAVFQRFTIWQDRLTKSSSRNAISRGCPRCLPLSIPGNTSIQD